MGLTTFSTALSGLSTNSQGLNVVGNNLANLNTVGFKASNISFTDVLGQFFGTKGTAKSGNVMSIGLGAQVSSVRQSMIQGSLQTTNNPLDVAIQGKGFLVVKNNGVQQYSRAGNLHVDMQGNLVADNGGEIQGYMRDPLTGQIDPTLGLNSIRVPSGTNTPVKTSEFEIAMNLDAGAADGAKYTQTIQIYDSLGKQHMATLSFQKQITGGSNPTATWHFDITIPNNEIAGVAADDTSRFSLITGTVANADPDAGALVFDSNGKLTSAYTGTAPGALPALADLTFPASGVALPSLANGATLSSAFNWKLLHDGTPNITGYTSPSDVSGLVQNGFSSGSLSNLLIGSDGVVSAIFDNGTATAIGQIVLAQFTNTDGLLSQGGGLYAESLASGPVLIGAAGEGGRGVFMSATLEQSNVDMAAELTKIITFQRAYQANARMISVTDQILQETMNMRQ